MRTVILVAMALATSIMAGASQHASAQSFDCRRASLDAEYAICANARLGILDEEMSSLFYSLPRALQRELRQSQLAWLRQRNACGYDIGCIRRAYIQRIEFLRDY